MSERFNVTHSPNFTPFWRRLPHFFVYPLQFRSMLYITGYSIIGTIAMLVPEVMGKILNLILWIVFLKYAFLVMERTANGQFDEPDDLSNAQGDSGQVMRQFGLFMVLGLLFILLYNTLGKFGQGVGWLLFNMVIPASIMIIAVDRSIFAALNPARIFFFMKTIGTPYLALCFILLSISSSGEWLQHFAYKNMSTWLALPLLSVIDFYFTLIAYHMMGYAIYQNHQGLGSDAAVSFEQAEAKLAPGKAPDPLLGQLSSLLADNQLDAALALLSEALRTRWDDNDLHQRYQKLLLLADKQTLALHHAREFINKLVNEKRLFQALDLYDKSVKSDAEFQLQDSYHVYELATAARLGNRHQLALDLMRRFDRRYPQHPHIPQVYFLTAQILSEHFNMRTEALAILNALHLKFPQHELATEARAQMDVLNKLAAIH